MSSADVVFVWIVVAVSSPFDVVFSYEEVVGLMLLSLLPRFDFDHDDDFLLCSLGLFVPFDYYYYCLRALSKLSPPPQLAMAARNAHSSDLMQEVVSLA